MSSIQSFEELLDAIASRGIKIPPAVASSSHVSHSLLLKGIERGWWTGIGASHNPNLEWSWIEEHLDIDDAIDLLAVLFFNKTISWSQFNLILVAAGYSELAAARGEVMPSDHVPVDFRDVGSVFKLDSCTYEMYVDEEFDSDCLPSPHRLYLSRSPTIPVELIIEDLAIGRHPDRWDLEGLCQHPHLTMEMIEKETRINWGWYPLLCKSMEREAVISLFEKHRDQPDAVTAFWSHPAVTLDMVGTIEPLSIDGLSQNPNLTWNFIIDNLAMMSNSDENFESMMTRSDWSISEGMARDRAEAAAAAMLP